jgi:hypothetical protein
MNTGHLHLIVNHLPIVGVLIGILVLLAALWLGKSEVKLTALGILIGSAAASALAFYTGESAEDLVENIPGISETLIHTHEEYAETFLIVTLILGVVAALAFLAELKNWGIKSYLVLITLVLAISAGVLATYVGSSGGEIRHSEIRTTPKLIDVEADED